MKIQIAQKKVFLWKISEEEEIIKTHHNNGTINKKSDAYFIEHFGPFKFFYHSKIIKNNQWTQEKSC